jgi:acyl-CoA thioester hydrolase
MITYQTTVIDDWVDYNGHLRDAFYLLIFSYATDAFMERIGVDPARDNYSLFTLECHLNFLQEVKLGAAVNVHTRVIGHDHKRLHLYHSLHTHVHDQPLAATEQMLVHVDLAGPRSAPFGAATLQHLSNILDQQSRLSAPSLIGRVIGLNAPR